MTPHEMIEIRARADYFLQLWDEERWRRRASSLTIAVLICWLGASWIRGPFLSVRDVARSLIWTPPATSPICSTAPVLTCSRCGVPCPGGRVIIMQGNCREIFAGCGECLVAIVDSSR